MALCDALALFQRYLLEDSRDPGPHLQVIHLLDPQLPERLQAVDVRLFGGQLNLDRLPRDLQPFLCRVSSARARLRLLELN